MELYHDAVRKKEREDALSRAGRVAASSGLWGTGVGAFNRMLHGERSPLGILLGGLGTGAAGAGLGAGAALLGDALMGAPREDDPSAYTRAGAAGGAVGGGLLGSAGGYLLGTGGLSELGDEAAATFPKAAKWVKRAAPLDNLMTDYVKSQLEHPSGATGLKLAAIFGLGGAALGAFHGMEGGMDQDTLRNLHLAEERGHASRP